MPVCHRFLSLMLLPELTLAYTLGHRSPKDAKETGLVSDICRRGFVYTRPHRFLIYPTDVIQLARTARLVKFRDDLAREKEPPEARRAPLDLYAYIEELKLIPGIVPLRFLPLMESVVRRLFPKPFSVPGQGNFYPPRKPEDPRWKYGWRYYPGELPECFSDPSLPPEEALHAQAGALFHVSPSNPVTAENLHTVAMLKSAAAGALQELVKEPRKPSRNRKNS